MHIYTKSGYKGYGTTKEHLYLAIDAFTRFVWAVASSSKFGIDFIHLIQKVISLQRPKIVVGDNYPAMARRIFQDYLKKERVRIIFTVPNNPSSNGIVERVNQTLVQKLKCKRMEEKRVS